MAISHKARYCNGFPNFVSNTEVLSRSIQSIHSRPFLSIPALSGHKSGHIFSGEEGTLSANAVGFSCTKMASNQRVRGTEDMVINQMLGGQVKL
jgi:hypothetical protein